MQRLSFLSRVSILALFALLDFSGFATDSRATKATKSSAVVADEVQTSTEMRLLEPGWWPTKGTATRDAYAGSAACARCHADKAESYAATPMAHAVSAVTSDRLPELRPGPLHFLSGAYRYEL